MGFIVSVEIDPHNPSGTKVTLSGENVHVITDKERMTFGIDDASLKRAVQSYFGMLPNDVFVRSPTPWNDLYTTYNWEQVTVHVRPVSAQILSTDAKPELVKRAHFVNKSPYNGTFNVHVEAKVYNSSTVSWAVTEDVAVTESVSYNIELAGSDEQLSYNLGFQQGGESTKAIEIGTGEGVDVELAPGQEVWAVLSANLGTITMQVTFESYLSGLAAVNYDPKFKDHHFWGLSIDGLRQQMGLKARLPSVEVIQIGFYSDSEVVISDPRGSPSTRLRLPIYRRSS